MSNENDPGLFGVHTLSNGRKYRLSDHGVYKPGSTRPAVCTSSLSSLDWTGGSTLTTRRTPSALASS